MGTLSLPLVVGKFIAILPQAQEVDSEVWTFLFPMVMEKSRASLILPVPAQTSWHKFERLVATRCRVLAMLLLYA